MFEMNWWYKRRGFCPSEEGLSARSASQAPRNSLAVARFSTVTPMEKRRSSSMGNE
jgi:hypothetical protein